MTEHAPRASNVVPTAGRTGKERLARVLAVLALDPTMKFGSLEEQAFILAREFKARNGAYVPAFTRPVHATAAAEYTDAGLPVEALDLHRVHLRGLLHLLRLIRRHRIEVIHWHFYHPLNPYLWLTTVFAPSVRHFRTDHSSREWDDGRASGRVWSGLRRTLLRRYGRVTCVSKFVLRSCEREGVWSNLVACDHFVNTDRFQPDATVRARVRADAGVGNAFVALVVAHLIPQKGVDVALRALLHLPPHVQLWVVGEGIETRRLHALSAELGLEGRVKFLGRRFDVAPLMQSADCLVCPSLWAEAAGLVNLEASACGLPIVASAVGGIPEYVDDGESGLLFSRGNAVELAERVERISRDPALARRLASGGRERALARFSKESRLEDYLALYRISNEA